MVTQVGVAVVVQVGQCRRDPAVGLAGGGRVRHRRGEPAAGVDRDRGGRAEADGQVGPAVAVDVGGGDALGRLPPPRRTSSGQGTRRRPQTVRCGSAATRCAAGTAVGDGDVGPAVAGEVGDGHLVGPRRGRELLGGRQRPVAAVAVQQEFARGLVEVRLRSPGRRGRRRRRRRPGRPRRRTGPPSASKPAAGRKVPSPWFFSTDRPAPL